MARCGQRTHLIARGLAAFFALAIAPAEAQDAACGPGSVAVYRSEEGPPEDWRDSYAFDRDASDSRKVLHYIPATGEARWLRIGSGATGVPYRGLRPEQAADEDAVLFRFVRVREGNADSGSVVTALLADMMLYFPECAAGAEVERWIAAAQ